MDKSLLDTDILSEVLRGKNPSVVSRATEYLSVHPRITISVVSVTEIVKGLHKRRDSERLDRFLGDLAMFEIVPLSVEASAIAGRIFADLDRAGQPIGRADPFIAAICIHEGLRLATGNTDHFRRIQMIGYPLILEDWRNP